MVESITHQTHQVIRDCLDGGQIPTPGRPRLGRRGGGGGHHVRAETIGHIESIDLDGLCRLATKLELVFHLPVAIGDYVAEHTALVSAERCLTRKNEGKVRQAFRSSERRSLPRDPAFGFRELVDIAIKAMSPAVNDSTTACNCVDGMSSLLVVLGSRDWPEPRIRDHNGVVRLVLPDSSFEDYLELAAGQLRIYGKRDIHVMLRLVDMLIQVQRESTGRRNVQKAVAEQAARLKEAGEQGLELECDRLRMRESAGQTQS